MQEKSIGTYIHYLLLVTIFSLWSNQTITSATCDISPDNSSYNNNSHDRKYIYEASELASHYKQFVDESFLVGASTSEHQCSKECTPEICDWSRFAQQRNLKQPTDPQYTADFWNNYPTYIDQLKDKLNINALRISIEWALVQPRDPSSPDDNPMSSFYDSSFDKKALQHYADMIAYMIEKNITPIICFHHYTSPCWFADKGGFETIENCSYFKNYCLTTYQYITKYLTSKPSLYQKWLDLETNNRGILLATFNSPEGVSFKGYRQGEGPPSNPEKQGLYWVTLVLRNMMEAHVQASLTIKAYAKTKPDMPQPKIGFLKNIIQFDPTPNLNIFTKAITAFACSIARKLNDTSTYDFFTKGVFSSAIPFVTAPAHHNPDAPKSLDWIGLNYYSNTHMKLFSRITPDPNDPNATDNTTYTIYPYGLYRALCEIYEKLAKPLNIPIYVTENGVATSDSDKKNRFYKEYLHELLRAIKHKIPVMGYFPWTAFDNYEWPKTNTSNPLQSDNRKYGLTYPSDDGKTLTPKTGASYFIDWARSLIDKQTIEPELIDLELVEPEPIELKID